MNSKKLTELYKRATKPYNLALGYPVNRHHAFKISLDELGLIKNSFASSFLNNIGSPYSHGQYISDNVKEVEVELINLLAKHLNLSQSNSFGYVTNGGTEANFAAIWWHRELLQRKFKGVPVIIASDKSHYSVQKIANQLQLNLIQIPTIQGKINLQVLVKILKTVSSPVIYWANFGTTVDGIVDDILGITKLLKQYLKDSFKIHGDGALYGLVIPYLPQFKNICCIFDYVDTLSISGHKLLGSYFISGIILCKKSYIKQVIAVNNRSIAYLQNIDDVTVSGSRSGFLSIELYLLLNAALEKATEYEVNLSIMWNKCVKRANWFYKKISNIIGANNPNLSFNNYQLNVILPAPIDKVEKDIIAEKYKLMAIGSNQLGICVLPRSTIRKLKLFLADYAKCKFM